MKLKLVKQGDFLGTKCDFYVNVNGDIFMSRTQIGYALQYADPSNAIKNIHNKYHDRFDRWSVELTGAQFEPPLKNNKSTGKVYMYEERGVYEVCRRSRQKTADDFNDWVYSTILSIKKNGYYIASDKDERWLGIRQETKEVRKDETDHIKAFIAYAKEQGSGNADRYYVILTKLINNRLGIDAGGRDKADQKKLMKLKGLETVVGMHLDTLMREQMPYKQIYQDVKKMIDTL